MSDSATIEPPGQLTATLLGMLCAVVCLLGASGALHAQQQPAEAERRVFIDAVTIKGLDRTEPFVVHRELLVEQGQTASIDQIDESIQRVRNTGLFRKVRYDLVDMRGQASRTDDLPGGVSPVALEITVDEKWTTLPIFAFSRGGGTYRIIAGAFDDNLFGRFIGVGGQYERLGDTNSFYGWIYHPRLFDQRLRAGIDIGTRNRTYTIFDDSGEIDGGFLLERFTVGTYLQKEWLWWFRTQANLRFVDDDFSYELLPATIAQMQRERGLPPASHALIGGLTGMLGRIDQDNYLLDGTLFSVSLSHANDSVGSSHTYTKVTSGLSHFETLPWKINLGARIAAGTGDIDAIQHRFYLGGLDTVRGFPSDRFRGENYWLANLEFRIPSLDTRWVVLQHLLFVDAAGVSDQLGDLGTLSGASVGLGVRFIVPKIHGFIARLDYAFPLYGDVSNPWSLGGGQFF